MEIIVKIDANIDYPEYDIEEITNKEIINKLKNIKEDLSKLINTYISGKMIKEGINMAIIGSPNVGKSSLLNTLLLEERAIVTDIPGTTRDTIEETIQIEGIPINIIDTAGIRKSEDKIEKIGIEKTRKIANRSDLILAMFDISNKLTQEDKEILEIIKDKKAIIILNKIDLKKDALDNKDKLFKDLKTPIIRISTIENEGIDNLQKEIIKMFKINSINLNNDSVITNIRHKELLNQALENTNAALEAICEDMPIDIISINIKEILENLSSITGQNVSEDIIKEIFAKFCLGK